MKKKLISLFIISLLVDPFLALPAGVQAQDTNPNNIFGLGFVDGEQGGGDGIALGNRDPRTMVAEIINVVLTLLGIIAVGIVLLGGFKWMTAGGNEDKVGEAKKLLGAGVIGLVIILAAWGIARFALNALISATREI